MLTKLLLIAFTIKQSYSQRQNDQYPQNSFLEDSFISYQDPYGVDYQEDESNGKDALFYFHQYTNFIGWAILVDLGIIANRYGILLKKKYDIHAIIMSIVVLPSIITELYMIISGYTPQLYGNQNLQGLHSIIGYIFLGMMIIQLLGGVILKFCIQSVNTQTHLKIKSLLHIYSGYIVYFLGKIQLGFGYYMTYQKQNGNIISFWCVYGFIFLWRIIFEFFQSRHLYFYNFSYEINVQKQFNKIKIIVNSLYQNGKIYSILNKQNQQPKEHSGTLQDSLLIQYIEQNEQSHIYNEFQNKLWLIFNDEIIDLTEFTHPGGQYIWERVKGREVSRFVYGGCGLEDGTAIQYPHSQNAIVLLKNHIIGSLNNIAFTIPNDENTAINSTQWKLETVTKLNDKTSYFGFTNSKFNIVSQFTTIHSFGKYFQIQSIQSKNTPIRQYTCIASMAPENVAYRKELVKYIDYIYTTKQQAKVPQQPKYLKELPLIIKCYESKNGFSQYIHNHKDEIYDIQGPYGPPHGIPNRGKIVIICGGTGIFPFLDLFDFLLKTIIHQIALNKFGKQTADTNQYLYILRQSFYNFIQIFSKTQMSNSIFTQYNLNPYDCQFDPNIHITLFFAAANKTELIGSDILFPIIQLQKYLDKPFLRLIIKIKDKLEGIETIEERFSKEMFDKFLGKTLDYQRYLICGPPPMQASVPIILQEMGVQTRFIHFI